MLLNINAKQNHYIKNTDVYYDIYIQEAKEYMKLNNTKDLPNYFISSTELNWKDRVEIQGIIQKYVDTSISSTVNLPELATIEDIMNLYVYAWKLGCKGITVFRENCKRVGILTTNTQKENQQANKKELPWGTIIQANDDCIGRKRKLMSGCGSIYLLCYYDSVSGQLLETYINKGSSGTCLNNLTAISRLMSLSARAGVGTNNIIDQLMSCGNCPSYSVRTAVKRIQAKGQVALLPLLTH